MGSSVENFKLLMANTVNDLQINSVINSKIEPKNVATDIVIYTIILLFVFSITLPFFLSIYTLHLAL